MIKKILIACVLIAFADKGFAQQPTAVDSFWVALKKHCGKTYEGKITAGGREGDGFTGQRLVMQVKACELNRIRIPFFVGNDKSRTWVLTREEAVVKLKHDHRHEDGTPDRITQYGGTASNTGSKEQQVFPADQETCDLISYACGNVWWITLTDKVFTYNLRRVGSDRLFTVSFDLSNQVSTDFVPWGWKE